MQSSNVTLLTIAVSNSQDRHYKTTGIVLYSSFKRVYDQINTLVHNVF